MWPEKDLHNKDIGYEREQMTAEIMGPANDVQI